MGKTIPERVSGRIDEQEGIVLFFLDVSEGRGQFATYSVRSKAHAPGGLEDAGLRAPIRMAEWLSVESAVMAYGRQYRGNFRFVRA